MSHCIRTPRSASLLSATAPALLLALLLAAACAVPMAPQGGPQDRTPPALVLTDPPANAVNVETQSVRLVFSERVEENTLRQALTFTPAFEAPLTFRWKKTRVDIGLPEPLRSNTTYILTLDDNLRDAHGVTLSQPITFAFATGPVINRGRLAGRVRHRASGDGAASLEILAYALPDSLPLTAFPEHPDYRTQTDQGGAFKLDYLSEQPYFVVALEDRNRNRTPDDLEPFAAPPRLALFADSTGTEVSGTWWTTVRDTLAPTLRRIRAVSNTRLQVRFSEAVQLIGRDAAAWSLADSSSGQVIAVQAVYQHPSDPFEVFLQTSPLQAAAYRIIPGGVADSSDNPIRPDTLYFSGTATADTVRTRFEAFLPERPSPIDPMWTFILPGEAPQLRFNQPLPDTLLQAVATVADTAGTPRPYTAATTDGVTYRLALTPPMGAGQVLRLQVDGNRLAGLDTLYTATFQRAAAGDLGELSGIAATDDATGTLVVELYLADPAQRTSPRRIRPDSTGAFRFNNLPDGGVYRFRAFVDRNGNERWDGGSLIPFIPAEPAAWSDDLPPVRARWDSALEDTLRVR